MTYQGRTEEVYRGGEAVIELEAPEMQLPLRDIYQDVWNELTGPLPVSS